MQTVSHADIQDNAVNMLALFWFTSVNVNVMNEPVSCAICRERWNSNRVLTSIFIFIALATPWTVPAVEITPFQIRNQHPLIQIFGLPAIGDARVLLPGRYAAALMFDLANNYTVQDAATESLRLDGESYRFNL